MATMELRNRAGSRQAWTSVPTEENDDEVEVFSTAPLNDAVEAGVESHSSLPLQVSLYFHKFYIVVWIIGTLRLSRDDDGDDNRGVYSGGSFETILYALLYILEPMSIAIGYYGNLAEQTSALAGFGLTSVSIKLMPTLWLLTLAKQPMLIVLHAILATFQLLEAILSAFAITHMSRHETAHRIVLQPDPFANDGLRADGGSSVRETSI